RRDREGPVLGDILPEQTGVLGGLVVGDGRTRQEPARLFRGTAKSAGVARLEHHGAAGTEESVNLRLGEPAYEPEVEECDLSPGPEQIVARVRIAVETVEAVQAAVDESVDRFGREIAFLLRRALGLCEPGSARQLCRQHPP